MSETATALAIESWTLYAVGVCLILSRIISRLTTLGSPSRLQLDDWVMLAILVPFTGTVVSANEAFLSDGLVKSEVKGIVTKLKMRFVLEELQITTTWLVKICLLILYRRIFPSNTSKNERRFLDCTLAYCILSYVTIQLLLPIWCNPAPDYWSPIPVNTQCSTYRNHSILTLAFSTTTTMTVLLLPIPFIPTPRKYLLCILALVGVLVLVAEILSRYYVLTQPTSPTYLQWYVAETTLTILFANIPFLSSIITSTTTSRVRHLSSTLSLSAWPRSYKDTPRLRVQRERLESTATTISTLSPTHSQRHESFASTLLPFEIDTWLDTSPPPSVPPTPVRKLTLDDPPPELEKRWTTRRPKTQDTDVEKMGEFAQWPLR